MEQLRVRLIDQDENWEYTKKSPYISYTGILNQQIHTFLDLSHWDYNPASPILPKRICDSKVLSEIQARSQSVECASSLLFRTVVGDYSLVFILHVNYEINSFIT